MHSKKNSMIVTSIKTDTEINGNTATVTDF